jgi:hypothetical protein
MEAIVKHSASAEGDCFIFGVYPEESKGKFRNDIKRMSLLGVPKRSHTIALIWISTTDSLRLGTRKQFTSLRCSEEMYSK